MYLLSAADAVEAMEFWGDQARSDQHPWPSTWVPLLGNGSGDHVVYEAAGDCRGQLFAFWHDEADYWMEERSSWSEEPAPAKLTA
jgi:hypothetical protein